MSVGCWKAGAFLALSILAGCASPPSSPSVTYDGFTDINSRQDFYRRIMMSSPDYKDFADTPVAFQSCVTEGMDAMMPAQYKSDIDRFLADKSRANWDRIIATDKTTPIPDAFNRLVAISKDCKAKHI